MDLGLVFQAIFLGILQGLTEFLPISSSAHLLIVPYLLKWDSALLNSLTFDMALHLGTLVSVLGYFANDWKRLVRAGAQSIRERKIGADSDRRLAWAIVIGAIPGGVVGVLAESKIEDIFHAPLAPLAPWAVIAIAALLALLGLALFIAERVAKHQRELAQLTLRDALLIGVAQAAAVFPGVSRSGSTLAAGLFLGLKRDDAARFSFLLGAPIIAGAGLKSVYDVATETAGGALGGNELGLYVVGFGAAALTGFLAIRFLLRYLRFNSTDPFVYYRWALAGLLVILALFWQ